MVRRTLVAAASVVILAVPTALPASGAAPDARAGTQITGTWKGKVYNQDGPAGYSGTVRLTRSHGSYRATVRYSGGVAATRWTYRGRDGAWFRFRETARTSSSSGGVIIKARRKGAHLLVRWRVPGIDYTGHMKAHRHR